MGLREGWSLDFTTHDETGAAWDFNQLHMRNKAVRELIQDRPLVLIGGQMCTAYSAMSNINFSRTAPEEVQQRLAYAKRHLDFCVKLYELQWQVGRYFLHEHLDGASSWMENSVVRRLEKNKEMQGLWGGPMQVWLGIS